MRRLTLAARFGEGAIAGECGCRVGEGGQVAAENDSAQRDGCAGFFFPEFAQVKEFCQAFLPVGEPVFVDDHAAVDLAGEYGVFDRRKRS